MPERMPEMSPEIGPPWMFFNTTGGDFPAHATKEQPAFWAATLCW